MSEFTTEQSLPKELIDAAEYVKQRIEKGNLAPWEWDKYEKIFENINELGLPFTIKLSPKEARKTFKVITD